MKIKTESFVHVGGELVNTKELTADQKQQLADWLAVTYLNELFRGKAEFRIST